MKKENSSNNNIISSSISKVKGLGDAIFGWHPISFTQFFKYSLIPLLIFIATMLVVSFFSWPLLTVGLPIVGGIAIFGNIGYNCLRMAVFGPDRKKKEQSKIISEDNVPSKNKGAESNKANSSEDLLNQLLNAQNKSEDSAPNISVPAQSIKSIDSSKGPIDKHPDIQH